MTVSSVRHRGRRDHVYVTRSDGSSTYWGFRATGTTFPMTCVTWWSRTDSALLWGFGASWTKAWTSGSSTIRPRSSEVAIPSSKIPVTISQICTERNRPWPCLGLLVLVQNKSAIARWSLSTRTHPPWRRRIGPASGLGLRPSRRHVRGAVSSVRARSTTCDVSGRVSKTASRSSSPTRDREAESPREPEHPTISPRPRSSLLSSGCRRDSGRFATPHSRLEVGCRNRREAP